MVADFASHRAGESFVCLLALVLTGCGGGLAQVKGKVTFPNGKPLNGGTIVFELMDGKATASTRGIIQEDGTFRMGTFADADGAPPGRYRALVTPTKPRNPDRPPPEWPPIDPVYWQYGKSPLEITVQPGSNDIPLVVAKVAPKK